jgi:hypothetical protein
MTVSAAIVCVSTEAIRKTLHFCREGSWNLFFPTVEPFPTGSAAAPGQAESTGCKAEP